MHERQFNRINLLLGWLCFGIALVTYWQTVEPSISFWDCPEYVACAAKGEVGHPPGNTFFLLAGRFFANFACGDTSSIALWVNRMSALFSAGTILFLFWTITALTGRLLWPATQEARYLPISKAIVIFGSGLVGALVFTWSDTFWFSAVEAEVYGFSSFMTAITFWLVLRWEKQSRQVSSDRYLILISYVVGLSIGVHLLNLLCLPAIVLVYCFSMRRQMRRMQVMGVVLLSFLLIALILFVLIPGVVWLAQKFELLFVNGFGCRYNTGALVCFVLLFVVLVSILWSLYSGHSPRWVNRRLAFNITAMLLMMLVGYSTYAQVLIRSSAWLPMNENAPDNVFALARYLNREQYGSSPLLYGQTFASEVISDTSNGNGAPLYRKAVKQDENEPDRYWEYDRQHSYRYDYNMLFPRMYSEMPEHVQGYKKWSGFKGKLVRVPAARGGTRQVRVPTVGENLTYFFRYQLGYMYWRYFFWNFCGRQNDLKGNGEADRGNWITGISLIDSWLVGNQNDLPRQIVGNKGHNVYYMLPLLLGLLGLCWQWHQGSDGRRYFLVVLMLFVMTGIAIVVYINQPPFQPRERDYSFVGSFYAFSVWIGMGVAGLVALLKKIAGRKIGIKCRIAAAVASVSVCIGVPIQMVGQNWDDHDRSDRYLARDFGRNYLSSLDPDGILFCSGDNETFPLWYAIEVEGFRTDARVCNLCYLQTDWYIDQMKSPAYESAPLPIPYGSDRYAGNRMIYSALKTDALMLPGDSIVPEISIQFDGKKYLQRQEIIQLSIVDSIARSGWKRPVYFTCSAGTGVYGMFSPYLRTVGLAYQIVASGGGSNSIDVERTFDCLMNRFRWGNADKPGIYLDETALSMCYWHRIAFSRLIDALLNAGDKERALLATRRCLEVLPSYNIPYDYTSLSLARCLYECDEQEDAVLISVEILKQTAEYLHWVFGLDKDRLRTCESEIRQQLLLMQGTLCLLEEQHQTDLLRNYYTLFKQYYDEFKRNR